MQSSPHVVVIGGGIIGLATTLALLDRRPDARLTLLEKEATLAMHQTGNNSGVIHSGIYYRPGSLKARLCVEGARLLVDFAEHYDIPHEICGKVIVASDESELPRLAELKHRAEANGVAGVEMLEPDQVREIEPYVAAVRGLRVPATGIIDYVAVNEKIAELVRDRGADIRTSAPVRSVEQTASELIVETDGNAISATHLVNCAGLHSDVMARLAGCAPTARIIPFRGEYYELAAERRDLVRSLIYPVPDPAFPFLGVHFTRRIDGSVEAGPNAVLALRREGYSKTDFNLRDTAATLTYPGFWRLAAKHWRTGAGELYRSFSKAAFVATLQELIPSLDAGDLRAGGAGVRAQAVSPDGELLDDFAIQIDGRAVHVLNAPSPAATASLAIGQTIVARMAQHFDWS